MTSLGLQEPPVTRDGLRISTPVLYALLMLGGWAISGYVGYSTAIAAMNARVSVLESEFQQMRSDVSEIRTDVKTLLGRK